MKKPGKKPVKKDARAPSSFRRLLMKKRETNLHVARSILSSAVAQLRTAETALEKGIFAFGIDEAVKSLRALQARELRDLVYQDLLNEEEEARR